MEGLGKWGWGETAPLAWGVPAHPLQTLSLYQLLSLCYPEPPILVATFFLHVEIGDAQRIPGPEFSEMKAFKNSIPRPPPPHSLTHSLEL